MELEPHLLPAPCCLYTPATPPPRPHNPPSPPHSVLLLPLSPRLCCTSPFLCSLPAGVILAASWSTEHMLQPCSSRGHGPKPAGGRERCNVEGEKGGETEEGKLGQPEAAGGGRHKGVGDRTDSRRMPGSHCLYTACSLPPASLLPPHLSYHVPDCFLHCLSPTV